MQNKHTLSTKAAPRPSVSGNLGKEPSLRHQAERKLVTGVVQEVFELQESHAAQLPPVPPVNPNLQLTGLYGEDQADEWGSASASTRVASPGSLQLTLTIQKSGLLDPRRW